MAAKKIEKAEKAAPKGAELTAGNIAKELGVSDAKVKKALTELGIAPSSKKGVCNYYPADATKKIKAHLG